MLHNLLRLKPEYGPVERALVWEFNEWIFAERDYYSLYKNILKESLKRDFIENCLIYYSLSELKQMESFYRFSPRRRWNSSDSSSSNYSQESGSSLSDDSDDSSSREIF